MPYLSLAFVDEGIEESGALLVVVVIPRFQESGQFALLFVGALFKVANEVVAQNLSHAQTLLGEVGLSESREVCGADVWHLQVRSKLTHVY